MADDAAQLDSSYGKRLKAIREEQGMTQAEVVKRLRDEGVAYMNPSTLSRIETGDRAIRLSEAGAFSRIYRFPLSFLTEKGMVYDVIASASVEQREARRQYVVFRGMAADLAETQAALPGRIRGLELLGDQVHDEDAKHELDLLIRNIRSFAEIDLPAEVSDFVELARRRYNEAAKSPAGRFLNQREADRAKGGT